jgi:hypothetical protein
LFVHLLRHDRFPEWGRKCKENAEGQTIRKWVAQKMGLALDLTMNLTGTFGVRDLTERHSII